MRRTISLFKYENIDLLAGNIKRNVILLAIPMLLEMLMATIFSVVDMVWVGKLGTSAIAAVSMCSVIMMLFFAMVVGIGVSSTAMISHRVGRQDSEAGLIIFHTLLFAVCLSFVYVASSFYSKNIMLWMGAVDSVVHMGADYLRISLLWGGISIFLFSVNSLFRGAGHALEAMLVLTVANGVNLVLDPILIFGFGPIPAMGVSGAAWGTVVSHCVGVMLQFFWLVRGTKAHMSFDASNIVIRLSILKKMLFIAIPASLQLLLRIASTFVLMKIVAGYGTNSIAAYGIGLTILRLVVLPGLGIGNASATMVGQNSGAGYFARASESAWLAARYSMVILGVTGCVIAVFARPVAMLFNTNPVVIELAVQCIRIFTICFVFTGLGIVMSRSLMGAGDAISPMIINFTSLWVIQIPLAYYLSLSFMAKGVWIAITVGNCTAAFMGAWYFKAGGWQKRRI